MPITRTPLLDLPIIESNTETGTWGNAVNNGLTSYLDIAIAGMTVLTGSNFSGAPNYNLTLTLTEGDASATNIVFNSAQYATIKVSSLNANSTLICPSSARSYKIINSDATYSLTVAAPGQPGVAIAAGATATVIFNGTDYVASGVQATGVLTSNTMIKGAGTTFIAPATAGTDFVSPTAVTSFSALQNFIGTPTNFALNLANSTEIITVVNNSAIPATLNYDISAQSVLFYDFNSANNWTVNFRASSTQSLNAALANNRSITVALLAKQGGTAFYNNLIQIDGNQITPKYQTGVAWTSGNVNSIDIYLYTIIKTAAAPYTVIASQTKCA
jgi:hypothetical protein